MILGRFFKAIVGTTCNVTFRIRSTITFITASVLGTVGPRVVGTRKTCRERGTIVLTGERDGCSASFLTVITVPLVIRVPSILTF